MAYVSRGFIPQCDLNINTGLIKLFYIHSGDSNATALYDIVKASTSGSTTVNNGIPAGLPGAVRITGINDVPVGVVVGFVADSSYLEQTHRTASTARVALVCYDPQVVLEAQEDNAGAATLGVSRIGTPVDVSIAAVDTVTGTSSMQIGSGALAGSPGMFRLQQRSFDPVNAAIGGTNTKWLVTFNVHQYKATT
jgi:hypothetical protein